MLEDFCLSVCVDVQVYCSLLRQTPGKAGEVGPWKSHEVQIQVQGAAPGSGAIPSINTG